MKKLILSIAIGLIAVTSVHAQQAVVIEHPGVLSDLVSAAGAIVALPLAAVEGIVVGTAEAAGSLVRGSTTVVVVPSEKPVPAPIAVRCGDDFNRRQNSTGCCPVHHDHHDV